MKLRVQYSIQLALFSFLTISCKKDFLNSSLKNTLILQEEYVTDLQKCSELVNGLYLNLSTAYGNYHTIYPEIIADNIRPVTGQNALSFHYNWAQMANEEDEGGIGSRSENLNGYSYAFYKIIVSSNYLIEKISEFRQEDAAKANNLQGQVLSIRALAYFQLVNAFAQAHNYTAGGDHPGIVYRSTSDWKEPVQGRSTVSFIYKMMIADLNTAISLLPPRTTTNIFFDQISAKALLSRILLFKQDYQQASTVAAEVSRMIPLTTIEKGYPNDLFKALAPGKTEVILQLLPGSSISMGYSGGGLFAGRYFRANRSFVATSDIGTLLTSDSNDIRKAWVSFEDGYWSIKKFPSDLIPDVSPADASYYHPVLRSSEMFLIAAEAFMQQNKEDSARFYLNAIRKRAHIDTLNADINGTALLDSIYMERRKELSFEGLRMYDLLRWKKGVYRKDAASPSAQSLPYPSNYAIAPLPIRDVNEGGLIQNPAY